ncbi:leucyl aminopeptidase Metallo peptidase. MEROPS family M28E [Duganella sp. CF458]|uniref:M20/M25/M40 family metallo-hydrolase n=1 Tax=Duganella sp. CF458 TaxID=1884368 RepID=UPI0008E5D592|nr:M20/M25/M40 family metallo-hydrolase [Duganella sp. CF458]SFH02924.1 leucyl aminopeptidase Metallo peptidase. MEROPS family M28E [Duganella sp. CF458]
MKRFTPVVLAAGLFAASAANAAPTWITLGDAAYAKLQAAAPQAVAKQSKQGLGKEKVHLVQVDEETMLKLSAAIHKELKRCGGFIAHASEEEGRQALAKAGTVQPLALAVSRPSYTIDNQSTVNGILPTLQASNIAQTITDMSNFANRYYRTTNGANAANWLAQKWTAMAAGRSDISVTQFTHSGYNQKSVIMTINGTDNGSEVVVMGGHLDSINMSGNGETSRSPGADDDASGVASLTEAARAMIASGYKPRRTIKIMGYAAEEAGLLGSKDIAANFKANNVNVVGVLQLDMTNYRGSSKDVWIYTDYTDSQQNTFMASLLSAYMPAATVGYSSCGYGCSDHASWQNQGFPASFPFEAQMGQDNPYIHTANDTLANSDAQANHALKFAQLAAAYAVELGSDGPGVGVPDRVETFTGTLTRSQKKTFGPFKAGVGTFKAETTGTGDIDLYVRKGSVPTTSSYSCKSDGSSATESCSTSVTANGDVYVMLNGYTAGNYNLKVTYKPQ